MSVEREARVHAQKLWSARACGELEGDKATAEYFSAVERERYAEQYWSADYFGFRNFRGKRVLEIGVGQGTDLAQFAAGGAHCFGVDITENHLQLTARNLQLRSLGADLRRADATALPFPDEFFDAVYSFGVLHHVPEIDKVMCEVSRVLAPGGTVMIALYHRWSAYYVLKKVLLEGVLMGRLLTLGLAGLRATIEAGADGRGTRPYVRLYTRRTVRHILRHLRTEDVSVRQLLLNHFIPSRFCGRWRFRPLPLQGWIGWYVVARARKT